MSDSWLRRELQLQTVAVISTRLPQLKTERGAAWRSEDTGVFRFKVLFDAWLAAAEGLLLAHDLSFNCGIRDHYDRIGHHNRIPLFIFARGTDSGILNLRLYAPAVTPVRRLNKRRKKVGSS